MIRFEPLLCRRLLCAACLLAAWLAAHCFVRNWDLPARLEHVPDAVVADAALTPGEAMQTSTYSYPPLQYLLTGLALPDGTEEACDPVEAASHRIIVRRFFSSAMELGLILLTFFFGARHLRMSCRFAWAAAQLFALLPIALFYSQTSNMDVPSAFWLFAAVFCATEAELHAGGGRRRMAFHLLAGVFLGAAFCTKDQVYALCILPAFALVAFRMKRGDSFRKAALPLLFWGAGFLPVVFAVYAWAGGAPVARAHFSWIVGGGRTEFFETGTAFADRLTLIPLQIRVFGTACDLPLLAALSVGFLLLAGRVRAFLRSEKIFLAALLLAFVSMQIFLVQILRTSHPRYAIAFLPFLSLLAFRMMEKSKFRTAAACVAAGLIVYSFCNAASFLSGMNRAPRRAASAALAAHPEAATATASAGTFFQYDPQGNAKRFAAYRSWSLAKLEPETNAPDLAPEPFFFFVKEPELLLLSDDDSNAFLSDLQSSGAYRVEQSFSGTPPLPTLFAPPICAYKLLRRNPDVPLPSAETFSGMPLSRQVMALEALARFAGGCAETEKLAWIGRSLRPFREEELGAILISRPGMGLVLRCFEAAERREDALRVRALLER